MQGETNLSTLISTLKPKLNRGTFVFSFISDLREIDFSKCMMTMKEEEGYAVITTKKYADEKKITYSTVFSWITLGVYSSLDAVGLTAKVSHALARQQISCNMVAAYHHDHVFVPEKEKDRAMDCLLQLSSKKQ